MKPIEELLGKRLPPDGSLGLSTDEVEKLDKEICKLAEKIQYLNGKLREKEKCALDLRMELEEWKTSPFSKWLETLFSKLK